MNLDPLLSTLKQLALAIPFAEEVPFKVVISMGVLGGISQQAIEHLFVLFINMNVIWFELSGQERCSCVESPGPSGGWQCRDEDHLPPRL